MQLKSLIIDTDKPHVAPEQMDKSHDRTFIKNADPLIILLIFYL